MLLRSAVLVTKKCVQFSTPFFLFLHKTPEVKNYVGQNVNKLCKIKVTCDRVFRHKLKPNKSPDPDELFSRVIKGI